jgi:hypothetical protein
MACACSSSKKRIYYANIQLFTDLQNGIPGGSSPPVGSVKEVTVCTECGAAEFLIPDAERRWFHVA